MKTRLLASLALASVLSLGAFGCASSDDGAATTDQEVHATPPQTIQASTEPSHEAFGGVWKVTGVDNEAGMDLGIIELGGGDPALNGDYLFLSGYGADHGDGGVFELGLNVRHLESVTMVGGDTIKLVGTQDDIDPKTDDFVQRPFEALVKLTLSGSDIVSVAVTMNGDKPETIQKTTEADKDALSSIFAVSHKESEGGNIIRLFETGGGDPAMNGDQLVLNIMSYPEANTYDLGLNVNSVTKFEVTDTKIFIEGTEHWMSPNDDIQSRPYAYVIDYAIGEDGVPASSIKMTRTR